MGIPYTHHCRNQHHKEYVDVIAQTLTTLSKLWLIAQHVLSKIFPVGEYQVQDQQTAQ